MIPRFSPILSGERFQKRWEFFWRERNLLGWIQGDEPVFSDRGSEHEISRSLWLYIIPGRDEEEVGIRSFFLYHYADAGDIWLVSARNEKVAAHQLAHTAIICKGIFGYSS